MRLAELSFELCRAQLLRQSAAGVVPKIMSVVFHSLDDAGKMFSCRAAFAFGSDYVTQFELDVAADLSDSDWAQRFDAVVFDDRCRWLQ